MGLEFNSPIILLMLLLLCITKINAKDSTFDVRNFGAVADGETDNSKAFLKAWTKACESPGRSAVMVPKGTYLVSLVVFEGPCKAKTIHFDLKGVLKAPVNGRNCVNQDSWVTFQYLSGLTLSGGGILDGQGASAWHCNDCSKNSDCKNLPTSLRLNFVNDSKVSHIKSINPKNTHMHVFKCDNMKLKNLTITAPDESPNTDGIHVATSTNIEITNSVIGTGDDCISMLPGTKFVHVSNIMCGPGHGISIGSLGRSPNNMEDIVTDLDIENCTFTDTMNGLRIKTWAPSNRGLVRNVTFRDIFINNADNPIIIDQQYCPSKTCDPEASSQIKISDIKFRNIWGQSKTRVAVNLLCSSSGPCEQIELTDINIEYNGNGKEASGPATSFCANVKGVHHGIQKPPACF